MEAVADRALADHRQLGVDVDGPGARARGRSASRSTAGRRPRAGSAARRSTVSTHFERKRVSNENRPVGSVERRLDVAARVADDEGVAVEDLDEAVAHCFVLAVCERRRRGGFRKSRRRSTISLSSPPMPTSPRSTRRHQVQLAGDRPFEARALYAQDAVRGDVSTRDAEVALVDRHQPALGSLAVSDVEAGTALRFRKQRLVASPAELGEEFRDRVGLGVCFSPTRPT